MFRSGGLFSRILPRLCPSGLPPQTGDSGVAAGSEALPPLSIPTQLDPTPPLARAGIHQNQILTAEPLLPVVYIYTYSHTNWLARRLSPEPFNCHASDRPSDRTASGPELNYMLFVALELWHPQKRLEKLVYFEISCNSIALQRRPPSKTLVIQLFFEEILQFP